MGLNIKPDLTGEQQKKDTRFKKGVSGNPNGRPVGSVSVVGEIKKKLLECPPDQTKTYLELLVARYFKQTIQDGDTQLIRDLINRVDGMPKQSNELSGSLSLKGLIDVKENDKFEQLADDSQKG